MTSNDTRLDTLCQYWGAVFSWNDVSPACILFVNRVSCIQRWHIKRKMAYFNSVICYTFVLDMALFVIMPSGIIETSYFSTCETGWKLHKRFESEQSWGVLHQKEVSKIGAINYTTQYLWDVITCPCTWYLLLVQHFSTESNMTHGIFRDCCGKLFMNAGSQNYGGIALSLFLFLLFI